MLAKAEKLAETGVQHPLCVDLDGTLINSDIFYESLFALIKINPLLIFFLPVWLIRGKSVLKAEIAARVEIDVTTLPYNRQVLDYLEQQKSNGRSLILVTATNRKFAKAIADHLGLFDDVIASDDKTNLRGTAKVARLVELWGNGNFDYIGNDKSDVKVWEKSAHAIVVNPDAGARKWQSNALSNTLLIEGEKPTLRTYLKSIRMHQWLKNTLLFVPIVLGHEVFNITVLTMAYLGFIAFSLCASSVYLLNDMIDLSLDRKHEKKRFRPLAAGTIPIQHGVIMMVAFLVVAFAISLLLPPVFTLVLAIYYAATLSYSLYLKSMLLIDTMTLAGLYTIRIIAGGAATATYISSWLLAFSVFFFLSLALVKRFVELQSVDDNANRATTGRGYRKVDLETLSQGGLASAFSSVLVLALYVDTPEVRELYAYPQLIWLVCPLVLYIIVRIWILARRGEMDDDPVVFIMSDWRSQIMVAAGAAVMVMALFI